MGRIEDNLTEPVWPIAQKWAGKWDIKTAMSAGIAALELLDAAAREKACGIAAGQVEYDFVIRIDSEDGDEARVAGKTKTVHDKARTRSAGKKQSQPSRKSAKN